MKYLRNYIDYMIPRGKWFFSKKEALSLLRLNESTFQNQAHQLSQKNNLKRVYRDFYMIVPDQYKLLGSLPPDMLIDSLMNYLNQHYYIGLLSAASYYGATHQQPMVFQIITSKAMRPIKLARGKIEFHLSKYCADAKTNLIAVPTGYAKISTREQTMIDLVRFYTASGYLSNVALVIKSLAERISMAKLKVTIAQEKATSVLQRLGYVLELLNLENLALIVENEINKRKTKYVLLRHDHYQKDGEKNNRWKIIKNDYLEIA